MLISLSLSLCSCCSGNRSSYDGFNGSHGDGNGLANGDGVNSLDQLNAMEKSLSDQVSHQLSPARSLSLYLSSPLTQLVSVFFFL